MPHPSTDVWEVLSTARSIRRFSDEPVDEATLDRCLEAATWAPNGANAQLWRFIVLDAPEQRAAVAEAARLSLKMIEGVYGMTRPDPVEQSRVARNNRATYELHDRGGADEWFVAGHVVVGWPRGTHGRARRRPITDVVFRNKWDPEHADIAYGRGARPQRKERA